MKLIINFHVSLRFLFFFPSCHPSIQTEKLRMKNVLLKSFIGFVLKCRFVKRASTHHHGDKEWRQAQMGRSDRSCHECNKMAAGWQRQKSPEIWEVQVNFCEKFHHLCFKKVRDCVKQESKENWGIFLWSPPSVCLLLISVQLQITCDNRLKNFRLANFL